MHRAGAGGGTLPVLPVIRSGPTTRLPLSSTPPVFPVTRTGPTILLGAQGPVSASPPTSTRPVVPLIVSGPVIVAPQIRTTPAPLAPTGPVIRPPSTSSEPPAATNTGPVTLPPAPMQTASPGATFDGQVCDPVMQGRVTMTWNDLDPAGLPARSATLQVTVVGPIANCDPDAGAQTGVPGPLPPVSAAVTAYVAGPPVDDVAFATTVAAGTLSVGGVRSILTVSVAGDDSPPWSSLAEYVTVVTPSAETGKDAVAPAVTWPNAPAPVAECSSESAQFVRYSDAVRPTVAVSRCQPAAFAGGVTVVAIVGVGSS